VSPRSGLPPIVAKRVWKEEPSVSSTETPLRQTVFRISGSKLQACVLLRPPSFCLIFFTTPPGVVHHPASFLSLLLIFLDPAVEFFWERFSRRPPATHLGALILVLPHDSCSYRRGVHPSGFRHPPTSPPIGPSYREILAQAPTKTVQGKISIAFEGGRQ